MSNVGENLMAALGQAYVDDLNASFYGKIRFPWAPMSFERVLQRDLWSTMIDQDLGSWETPLLPRHASIWVAGCGTNQAVFTALRFPDASILGSDLSRESLEVATGNARQLGIANLELKCESINEAPYLEKFDYVVCTGVIHHNAVPEVALRKLASALKPDGVMELMVYNQFHRVIPAAVQEALRTMLGCNERPNLSLELPIARKLSKASRLGKAVSAFLADQQETPEASFADFLIQPVEHSYTVASLERAAATCELDLLHFCIARVSAQEGAVDWNLVLEDQELRHLYEALPDTKRWHVTNLLLQDSSPMLWFYFQRRDAGRKRRTESELCDGFLNARFSRTATEREMFLRTPDGSYAPPQRHRPFPQQAPADPQALRLYQELDENVPLKHTATRLGLDTSFPAANALRIRLATTAFPYLTVRR